MLQIKNGRVLTMAGKAFGNGQVLIELDAKGTRLLSRITSKSVNTLKLDIGKPIFAQVKGIAVIE